MKRQIPFIFASDTADCTVRQSIETEGVIVTMIGVRNYQEACQVAREFVDQGAIAVELCSAFGPKGIAMVVDAIEDKVPVGAIRFDKHPAIGKEGGISNESGDHKFL